MRRLTAILILLLSLSSCGYGFSGGGSTLPDDVKKVAVAVVENETTVPQVGLILTEAIRAQFERFQIVEVVDREFEADAVLRAKITEIDTRVRGVSGATDIELETELMMNVEAELVRRSGQLLWKGKIQVLRDFASAGSAVVTSSAGFAQGGISAGTLGTLGSKELLRGEQQVALEAMVEEAAYKIYFESVASDF